MMTKLIRQGFKAEGMTCKSCEKVIEKQAMSIEGVKECRINYEAQEGEVVFDPSKTDIDEILDRIEEEQYECFILKDTEREMDPDAIDAEAGERDENGERGSNGKFARMRFKVRDMECKKCQEIIEKQVLKTDGAKGCESDVAERTVTVTFDPEKTDIEKIMEAVEKKGYECEGFADDTDEENAGDETDSSDSDGEDGIIDAQFKVKGMHCRSCEKVIEKQALSVDGVKSAKADYARQKVVVSFDPKKTDAQKIMEKIEEKEYECVDGSEDSKEFGDAHVTLNTSNGGGTGDGKTGKKSLIKPVVLTLALIAIILGGYQVVQGFASFDLPAVGGPASLLLLFGIGLLTGFHCVGMCGGFVMSYTTKNAVDGKKSLHISSHVKYGTGKLISYTAIGALFGLIGTIFVFTPLLRGAASIFAGIFLVLFGINTLNLIPALRRVSIPMPKAVSRFVFRKSDRQNRPLVTGLLNGLMIACGPLQALYIYAAGTGNVAQGALALFAFGLGTLPVMFGFGMFASFVSKSMTRNILKVSGLIVIMLGVIMLNRGLALMGTGYDFNSITASLFPSVQASPGGTGGAGVVVSNGSYQEIRMNVTARGWEPDRFVLKAGVPVKWIINGKEITGCNNAIQVPKLGLEFKIKQGEQVIEFTPPNEDTVIPWSCWMGMIQGSFVVKKDIDTGNQQQVQQALQNAPAPKIAGGCGCGGGGSGGSCH